MVAYGDFVGLSGSADSEDRGRAAHIAAYAYLTHAGPADEHAALYAALIGFLDDPSVKVRAALAYGLLHSPEAPRPILIALLQDAQIISRAVAQYSPALLDVDLLSVVRAGEPSLLQAIALRERLHERLVSALIESGDRQVILTLLCRPDIRFGAEQFTVLAAGLADGDAEVRGALLGRNDLPGITRLQLVHKVARDLSQARIVKGAIASTRLSRLISHAVDSSLTAIGEREALGERKGYSEAVVATGNVSARVMLHAVINGHVLFFADCIACLAELPRSKVFGILESGTRPALNALLTRCGLSDAVRNLIVRMTLHARAADLADDVAARHFVVTALTEELIVEHDGRIPPELEECFNYLSEQNIQLARQAARGVMATFATEIAGQRQISTAQGDFGDHEGPALLALPAA